MVELNDLNIQQLFGVEDAENESPDRLKQYFFRNKAFDNLTVGLPIRILVGHKGVGKSALLKVAFLEDQAEGRLAVWIRPDDLEGIAETGDGNLNTLIQEWKNGITNVIFRKIVEDLKPGEKLGTRVQGSLQALITSVTSAMKKYQSEIMSDVMKATVENYLKKKTIHVYIDDLDRGWEGRPKDITRVSALLNAIRDLVGSDEAVQFRLGLRSDVYFLVRTSDESTDKIERNIIWLTWTNHEILCVVAKRIETFFGRELSDADIVSRRQPAIARLLEPVIVDRFSGNGKWSNAPIHRVLLSLTRKRPRDLVKLFYGAAREAYSAGAEKIDTSHLKATFETYSGERLQDIINEFRTELPAVDQLIYRMKPTRKEHKTADSFLYSNDELNNKLKNIISQSNLRFANGTAITPKSLAEFLFRIDFITARKDGETIIVRRYFDQSRHLQNQYADFGFHWEIHPAYRWALQPGDTLSIFDKLDIESD